MKNFTYKVEQLISCVHDRPVIWDKTLESYKDKEERKHAWEEVFGILDKGYDEMTREDKRTISDLVINKWTNLRDTFLKSLKIQTLKRSKRKYIYHDELSFLLKVMPQKIIPDYNVAANDSDDDPISFSTYTPAVKREKEEASTSVVEKEREKRSKKSERQQRKADSPETDYTPRKRSRRTEKEELPPVDFVEMSEVNDPRVMNEDEAFFASLLPTVVKYSEDERLEFRIEVLAVMKSIHNKRLHKWDGTG